MGTETTDILISGGGVAGLTAAAAFGEAGFHVTIVDPQPPITEMTADGADLRTTAFLQPARDFLKSAGLWEQLSPFATPLQTMRIVDASGTDPVSRNFEAQDISDEPFGWNLPNWLLRREMVARLSQMPQVDFRPSVGFVSKVSRTKGAIVRLSDGSKVEAQLVIGADGRRSPVREALSIGTETFRYSQTALTFAVTHDAPHENVSTEVHKDGGPFTLVPLPDFDGKPCSAVVWMTQNADVQQLRDLGAEEFSKAASDRSAQILGPLTLVSKRTAWPIISQIAKSFVGPRTALVAEAAHVMPPIGAQGLNTSLKDLSCLLELACTNREALGQTAMLDAYETARYKDVKLRMYGIDMLNRTSMTDTPILQDFRRFGVQALHDIKPIRTGLMQMGLGARR